MADSKSTVKITITLAPETAAYIKELVSRMNKHRDDFNTHGPMTVERLAEMLLQDAAMIIHRPGSWEASNMDNVLLAHGYKY